VQVFFSFFRFAFFIFPDFSAISHFSCPRFHFAFSCPRFHFAFSCPRFHFAFFLHSRRWRPPVIARRGKCRVSSLGVLGRVGERGHPGGRRQREQRRAGVHARSLRPPGGFHERYDGAKGTGNDGEGWSCASRAATATRRDVDGRRRLTYLDVAWRAAGRMSPSSSSPVVLVVLVVVVVVVLAVVIVVVLVVLVSETCIDNNNNNHNNNNNESSRAINSRLGEDGRGHDGRRGGHRWSESWCEGGQGSTAARSVKTGPPV